MIESAYRYCEAIEVEPGCLVVTEEGNQEILEVTKRADGIVLVGPTRATRNRHFVHKRDDVVTVVADDATLDRLEVEVLQGCSELASRTARLTVTVDARGAQQSVLEVTLPDVAEIRWLVPLRPTPDAAVTTRQSVDASDEEQ